MRLTIELPDEQEASLKATAQALGLSAEEYARRVLQRDLGRTLAARVREIWGDMPDDVREKLPADGASQVDHYVYGTPKRGA